METSVPRNFRQQIQSQPNSGQLVLIVKKKATKTNITKETQINDNGFPPGLIQPPTKEELGAFVIQLDQTHWQHELQVLSAMSVNRILKVTANGTLLNGKRIIRPQDTATQLWL